MKNDCIISNKKNLSGNGDYKYPVVKINRKSFKISRLVAMLFHGLEIQDTKSVVCHKCDNPLCINPDHLFVGTQQDNITDMWAKNRAKKKDNRGIRNPRAKITEEQVYEIRALKGKMSYVEIGKLYGISSGQASLICRRFNWTHLPERDST